MSTNDAGVWVSNSLVHITYDPKVAGRTTTAPHTRVPPLRSNGGHIKKLVGAALRARAPLGTEAIAEGDAYIIYDGMKHGNEVSLTTAPFKTLDDKAMQKNTRTIRILYNEQSLRTRMSRQTSGPIVQMEHLYVVTANQLRIPSKDRTKYEGTNQGEVIGFVKACKWDDDDEILRAPASVVKEIFSKAGASIPVGGANPDGAKPEFADGREPIFYHTHPFELDIEVSHSYVARAHIDLTPGQGHRALYSIIKKLPYFGLTLSEKHKEILIKHLEAKVFKLMQEEGGPLYQPGLVALLDTAVSDEGDGGEGEGEEEEQGEDPEEEEPEEEDDEEDDQDDAKKKPKKKINKPKKNKPKSKAKSKAKKAKAKSRAESKKKASGARASIIDKLKKLNRPPTAKERGTKRKSARKDATAESLADSYDD